MTQENIHKLIGSRNFSRTANPIELIETHISWVIICDDLVYKIKKPIYYSFLDFSTLKKRKFYCEREIELNKRLTTGIYIDVQPVKYKADIFIGEGEGKIIDYAVKMHRVDREKQMDKLLLRDKVSVTDIKNLAEKISSFHKQAKIIENDDSKNIGELFNDLLSQEDFLKNHLLCSSLIEDALEASGQFLKNNKMLLEERIAKGYVRDCHGDLHSRNIFLLPDPQPFDCIEFNDALRQIDVLNEIAFLCMDLDAFGRKDLADLFVGYYSTLLPAMQSGEDKMLFIYYKAYRANIRAKVNSLRAKDAANETELKKALDEVYKYLLLMNGYLLALRK